MQKVHTATDYMQKREEETPRITWNLELEACLPVVAGLAWA